jgi:hypothetical protein
VARFAAWRPLFLLSGILIIIGGSRHPREATMAQMLGNEDWVLSHSLLLAGFFALLVGLILYRRTGPPERTRPWTGLAVVGTALQVIEAAFHAAAVVDHGNLLAGAPTPILTAHLWLTIILYPLFAVSVIGLIVAGARDRALGSPWIAWIGVAGAVAHGTAGPLVAGLGLTRFAFLFPLILLFALWAVLAALWPLPARRPVTV